jgi:tetratricopeptide (TPR) repeat protein
MQWQRDLAVLYEKVGEVLAAQGKLEEALKAYRDGLAIAEPLAAADRSNAQWQRDLGIWYRKVGEVLAASYQKVGDVRAAQGKLEEALKAYRDGFAIVERLAAADRSNTQWQRDLAVGHAKLASVYLRLGNVADASETLRKGREIMARLVTIAPSNAHWKEDLARFDAEIAGLEGRAKEAGKN